MIRKLITLFFFLCISTLTEAQLYRPLLDTVNRWYYMINTEYVSAGPQVQSYSPCNYGWGSGMPMWMEEYTAGDTVINAHTYKILIQQNFFGDCIFGFIREDSATEKIYFQDILPSPEMLLYDFSLQLGDTITINFFNSSGYFQSGLYHVSSVTTFPLRDGPHQMLNLNCSSCSNSDSVSWIEGLGNLGGVAYTYTGNTFGSGHVTMCPGYPHHYIQVMTCAEHNSKFYMDSCARQISENDPCMLYQDSCHYHGSCGAIHELSSISSFSFYPQPAKTAVTINLVVVNADEFYIVIHDITGKEIKSIHLGKQSAGNFSRTLDISSLSNGSYIFECRSPKGSLYKKLLVQK